jgi:hypothetical protein
LLATHRGQRPRNWRTCADIMLLKQRTASLPIHAPQIRRRRRQPGAPGERRSEAIHPKANEPITATAHAAWRRHARLRSGAAGGSGARSSLRRNRGT